MQAEILKRRLLTGVIGAPLALAVLAAILLWQLRADSTVAARLAPREQLLSQAQSARNSVVNAQDVLLGYLVSFDPADLPALKHALMEAGSGLKKLVNFNPGNPVQENQLAQISTQNLRWVAAMQSILAVQPVPGEAKGILARVAPITGSLLSSFDDFINAEKNLSLHTTQRRRSEQAMLLWLVPFSLAGIALALIVVSGVYVGTVVHEYQRVLQDAEEANLKTNNFLATVSHELRNPLNLILLWSRLLLSDERDEAKVRRGLTSIDRAAQAQAQLIEDLLDFAKIETGRLRLDLRSTDLPAVVKAGVDTMAPAAEAKGIDLQMSIDPRAGIILGDPDRLQQALWNLLSNAVKFTPTGGKIQVQLARINSHAELSVVDTGQGIAPSLVPHVFDRFWQTETSAQNQKKGMGLGLTIVRQIVAMHGGAISVHSHGLGKGATFTIRLPIPAGTEGFQYRRRHPTVVNTHDLARLPRLAGLRVLVVDDDRDATEALRAVLKSLDADAIVADSADGALELLSEHGADAIVSDIGMPGHDGLWLAKQIREHERRSDGAHLPLVALTAYGRVEDKVKIFSAGFDSHVIKPVDPAELAGVIRSVVEPKCDKF